MPRKAVPRGAENLKVVGPYSPVVQIGDHLHFSGIVPVGADKQPDGNPEDQVVKVLQKMCDLLEACGLTPDDVFSATVMLAGDLSLYDWLNSRWDILFGHCRIKPRRAVFAVAALPFGCAVEIVFDAVRQEDPRPSTQD
ncbi:MAG: RidA family protein [Candidatus Edwardsbacteria bacterium]|nr:RidA family protein [Candidatus Edwardsbacteria bacterium]